MADEDDDLDRARRGDRADADDASQEAFVRAFRGLAHFDGRADFFTWLYRITVNTALNALRSDKRGAGLQQRSGAEAQHVGGRPESLGRLAPNPAQQVQHSAEV